MLASLAMLAAAAVLSGFTSAQRRVLTVLAEPGGAASAGPGGIVTCWSDRTPEFRVRASSLEPLIIDRRLEIRYGRGRYGTYHLTNREGLGSTGEARLRTQGIMVYHREARTAVARALKALRFRPLGSISRRPGETDHAYFTRIVTVEHYQYARAETGGTPFYEVTATRARLDALAKEIGAAHGVEWA